MCHCESQSQCEDNQHVTVSLSQSVWIINVSLLSLSHSVRKVNYLLYNQEKIYEPQIDFTDLFDSSKLLISYNNSSQKNKTKTFG